MDKLKKKQNSYVFPIFPAFSFSATAGEQTGALLHA
jgi:hypothetical protein